jgi:NAD(P)-dependent dehydrogenase (short-subunit alcohol dehydrogenase family)
MRFNGEVAVVTGAGSGVGLVSIHLFLEAGCRVVATARRQDQLTMLGAISSSSVLPVELDVTSPEGWQRIVAATLDRFGGINILFNNAGITERAEILETSLDFWERVIRTNLTSVFLGCKSVIPAMLKSGGGAIVNHASINAIQGNVNLVAYSASKGGVAAMTRALAVDYATRGIRVNCICSAAIDTPMTRDYLATVDDPEGARDSIINKHPIGRMATAEEIASVAVFLASREASYMTGVSIPVDGGRSIR